MDGKLDDLKLQVRQELMKNDNIEKVFVHLNCFIISNMNLVGGVNLQVQQEFMKNDNVEKVFMYINYYKF